MTTTMGFRKAKRRQVWLRMFTLGQSKNGKTYTSLALALHLADLMGVPPEAVGVIDSEVDEGAVNEQQGSAEKYEGDTCQCAQCMGQGLVFTGFGTLLLPPGSREPESYIRAINNAKASGIKVLVIDSLTHEWEACLAMVDRVKGSSFNQGWGQVTPLHDRVISAIKSYPGHVLVTMRAKEKYKNTTDGNGKKQVTSEGIKPVQRPLIEYEFDFGMFMQHGNGTMVGARSAALNGKHYERPGLRLAEDLLAWSLQGTAAIKRDRSEGEQRAASAYSQQDPRETRASIQALMAQASPKVQAQTENGLKLARADREKLGLLLAWLKGKIEAPDQQGAQQAAPQQQTRREAPQQQRQQQPGPGHPQQQQDRQAPPQQQSRPDPTQQQRPTSQPQAQSPGSTTGATPETRPTTTREPVDKPEPMLQLTRGGGAGLWDATLLGLPGGPIESGSSVPLKLIEQWAKLRLGEWSIPFGGSRVEQALLVEQVREAQLQRQAAELPPEDVPLEEDLPFGGATGADESGYVPGAGQTYGSEPQTAGTYPGHGVEDQFPGSDYPDFDPPA